MAVDAVLSVADFETKDVNFELIKVRAFWAERRRGAGAPALLVLLSSSLFCARALTFVASFIQI